jgi:hypothetical protein
MPSSGMLRRVALLKTDVSEEFSAFMSRVTSSSETSLLTRATWRNLPEDGILHCVTYRCRWCLFHALIITSEVTTPPEMLKVVGASWFQTRVSTCIVGVVSALGILAVILGEIGR